MFVDQTVIPTLAVLEGVRGGIVLAIVGMLIVFVGLSIIALFISFLNKSMAEPSGTSETSRPAKRPTPAPAAKPAAASPKPVPTPPAVPEPTPEPAPMPQSQVQSTAELPDELIAVIAAAATAALRRPVRVRYVRALGEPGISPWVLGGRINVMNSHKALMRRPRG